MKFIFDGGFNKLDIESVKNNVFSRYNGFLVDQLGDGKKVLVVTNAKPVDYYKISTDPLLVTGAHVVNRDTSEEVNWNQYDYILIPGGATTLYDELIRLGFSIDNLKSDVVFIGSSIGTMIMANYFYHYDRENKKVSFHEGFIPTNKEIYVTHSDNIFYTDELLETTVQKFAEENSLKVVHIKENEVVKRIF